MHNCRCAVISCKLKQNANGGCNSCASLAVLVLSFIACLWSLLKSVINQVHGGAFCESYHRLAAVLTEPAIKFYCFILFFCFFFSPTDLRCRSVDCHRTLPDVGRLPKFIKIGQKFWVTRNGSHSGSKFRQFLDLIAMGVYPPNNHGAISSILTSYSPPFPATPLQTIFGHCIRNFVQFYACFRWILEAVSQG